METKDLIERPISKVSSNALLARLWRKVVLETGNSANINRLVFAEALAEAKEMAQAKKFTDRELAALTGKRKANLLGKVTMEEMTWKTLLTNLFNILKVVRIKFTIEITLMKDKEKETTSHSVVFTKDIPNE